MTPFRLFTFVELYSRVLATTQHLLDKGAEHARAQGGTGEECLDWRLIEDMNPARFQAMVVINFTRAWPARAADVEVPAAIEQDLDLAGFKAAITDAKAFLATLTPEQFEGRDQAPLTVKIGDIMEPTMPAAQWLSVFGTTNIYFHLTTLYGIFRARGVKLGKPDIFAGGL
jgi:uncharacterized protein